MSLRTGVAPIGMALLLAACTATPAHEATVVSRLDDMLADESVVNAIMGPPPLTATHTYRALEQWPAGYSYSPADCLAVSGNAMASVYQGTRSGEVRGTLFTNDRTGTEVDEAVVAFDTVAHARDFVASTVAYLAALFRRGADDHVRRPAAADVHHRRAARRRCRPRSRTANRSHTKAGALCTRCAPPATSSSMCGSPERDSPTRPSVWSMRSSTTAGSELVA